MKEGVGQKTTDRLWHSDMTSCSLYPPFIYIHFWFFRIPFRSKDTIVQVRFIEERFHRVCNVIMMEGLLQ